MNERETVAEHTAFPVPPRYEGVARGDSLPADHLCGTVADVEETPSSRIPFAEENDLGDVNGDGNPSNDAPFVFDPQRTPDPLLADGMRRLLDGADPRTRACLTAQLGRVAERNRCTRPWSGSLDAELTASFLTLRIGRGASVSLFATNLLGGLDALLHGTDGLRGWGGRPHVDPVLLHVRGFDHKARRFRYEVHPRFGAAPAGRGVFQNPATLQMVASVVLGKSDDRIGLDSWRHHMHTDETPDTAWVLSRYARGGQNSYAETYLRLRDRFVFTEEQVALLTRWETSFRAQGDSITRELDGYLATTFFRGPPAEIIARQAPVREANEMLTRGYLRCIRAMMSPDQWQMMGQTTRQKITRVRETPEERTLPCRRDLESGEWWRR